MSALWQSTVHICSPSQPPWLLWNLRPWLLASEQCGLGLVCDSPAPRPRVPVLNSPALLWGWGLRQAATAPDPVFTDNSACRVWQARGKKRP